MKNRPNPIPSNPPNAQVKIFRIDVVNGQKIGWFETDLKVNQNLVKQFKKDLNEFYTHVMKKHTEVMLCIREKMK